MPGYINSYYFSEANKNTNTTFWRHRLRQGGSKNICEKCIGVLNRNSVNFGLVCNAFNHALSWNLNNCVKKGKKRNHNAELLYLIFFLLLFIFFPSCYNSTRPYVCVSTLHILIDTVEIANLFTICFQKNPSLSDDIQMAN